MTSSPFQSHTRPAQSNQDDINFGKLLFLLLSRWPWFILTLLISISIAWLYIRYTLPTWSTSATILIEEESSGQNFINPKEIFDGFGLRPGMQNLDNQLLILTSRSTIEKTLDKLQFDVDYFYKGRFNKLPLYPFSPINVIYDQSGKVPKDIEYEFKLIDNNSYILQAEVNESEKIKITALIGDTIDIMGGKLRIELVSKSLDADDQNNTLYFVLNSRDKLIENYKSRLSATPASKEGTIINVSLIGTNREKDTDFLTKLIEVFINNNLEKKNLEAVRTIKFIDDQLHGISDSLSITEDKLQKFRSDNRVMDMSAQGQQIIEQAMQLENDRAKLVIESNYYTYLKDYLSNNFSTELPISPATIGIADPVLTKLVLELADLQSEYYSKNFTEKNPLKGQIAQRISNTKNALSETLKGVIRANEMAIKENIDQIYSVNEKATLLPKTERELLGIERRFKLNDVLYSFLIEKRAEAQIQKASNTPDNEIIDNPRSSHNPIAPSPLKTYSIALLFSFGLPSILIIMLKSIKNTINDEEDIKNITDLPIVGHVPHSEFARQLVVLDDPSSSVAEAFRSLRARIQFFTKGKKSPVLLVTSSVSEEGKTFTSINLASIYSLMGKKTLLIGFDLRKPKIYSDFNISNNRGISTWLIGEDSIDDVISKSSYENLDILPAGPIPPNPAELIMSEKTFQLIEVLKSKYEYIIIDSAPIGTVADSITLACLADATIILVRHGKTTIPLLSSTLEGIKDNGINSLSVLINDIHLNKVDYRFYKNRGYNYKYIYSSTKK